MEKKYAKAYTEVLEILKHIPEEELEKIPRSEIQFYEDNCDKNYKYAYNDDLSVDQQTLSKEANTVIVSIYMNYYANDNQKSIIEKILKQNSVEEEKAKSEKYDVNKIFEKNQQEQKKLEQNNESDKADSLANAKDSKVETNNLPVDISNDNDNFIKKIINKIKSLFRKA